MQYWTNTCVCIYIYIYYPLLKTKYKDSKVWGVRVTNFSFIDCENIIFLSYYILYYLIIIIKSEIWIISYCYDIMVCITCLTMFLLNNYWKYSTTLPWSFKDLQLDLLFNSLFGLTINKTSKFYIICEGSSLVTARLQRSNNTEKILNMIVSLWCGFYDTCH